MHLVPTRAGRFAMAVLVAAGMLAGPATAMAATSVNVKCTVAALSAAINAANAGGPSTLILAQGCTYSVKIPASGDDGLPIITGSITIIGGGLHPATIRRDPAATIAFRLLHVAGLGKLALQQLSITNGIVLDAGGAVFSQGILAVSGVTFKDNQAPSGGAITAFPGTTTSVSGSTFRSNAATGGDGGAILAYGVLTVTGSTFISNTTAVNGGAIDVQPESVTTVTGTTFLGNSSVAAGGALATNGALTLTRSFVVGNQGSDGGAIATGNNLVTLSGDAILSNSPNNCTPANTIPGCSN